MLLFECTIIPLPAFFIPAFAVGMLYHNGQQNTAIALAVLLVIMSLILLIGGIFTLFGPFDKNSFEDRMARDKTILGIWIAPFIIAGTIIGVIT